MAEADGNYVDSKRGEVVTRGRGKGALDISSSLTALPYHPHPPLATRRRSDPAELSFRRSVAADLERQAGRVERKWGDLEMGWRETIQ